MLVQVDYGPNLLATEVRFLAYYWCKTYVKSEANDGNLI